MFIGKTTPKGLLVGFVMTDKTEERLMETCFRSTHLPLAGRFMHWDHVRDILSDKEALDYLLDFLDELNAEEFFGIASLEISYSSIVGWSSTGLLKDFDADDLEEFQPSRNSTALRVRKDRRDLRAPQTNLFTIVFGVQDRKGSRRIINIFSLYPGQDIDELDGDITAEEGVVFFDWNHPGA